MAGGMKISLKDKVATPSPMAALSQMLAGSGASGIVELPLEQLDEIADQPYRLYTQEELDDLAADIRISGVLNPIIVQPNDERYQILAGRNRARAAKIAGLSTVPARIKEVDALNAELMLHSTNLFQRHDLRPSEKAKGYKRYLEIIEEIAQKGADEGEVHIVHSGDKLSAIARMADSSRRNVSYYLRLAALGDRLLELVDLGGIPVRAGVALSRLNPETQNRLLEYLGAYPQKINISKAEALYEMSVGGNLTRESIEQVMRPSKAAKPKKRAVKIRTEDVSRYFPGKTEKEIVREIMAILEEHFSR